MASDAEWSLGDHIEMGDGATPTEGFDRIPEVAELTYTPGTRTKVVTSSHDSTPPFPDHINTFLEGGRITMSGNYLPHNTIQQALKDKTKSDTATNFKIVIEADAGDVVMSGKATVQTFSITSNVNDARRFTAELEPTGEWI